MRMQKFYFLLPLSILVFFYFSTISFGVARHSQADTTVGIGFDESNSSEPIRDSSFDFGEESRGGKPKSTNNLPQLGQFIEPMIVILLGLLIWLVVLSLIAVRRYLRKEGGL